MKWEGRDLSGHVCRLSIDTVYFTAFVNIDGIESAGTYAFRDSMMHYSSVINSSLMNGLGEIEEKRNGFEIKETNYIGIYAIVSKYKEQIKINIQFKGVFFACEKGLEKMQFLMFKLMSKTGLFYRISRIDICQDITLKPFEILPASNQELLKQGYKYCFKHTFCEYHSSDPRNEIKATGFVIRNSRFTIRLYDKKEELKSCKNEAKKNFYEDYFSRVGEEHPVTRFEIQLKQNHCEPLHEIIYETYFTEETFCKEVLRRFSKKHKLRLRKENSVDKDWKRHPVYKNWEDLFHINELDVLKFRTPSDQRFTLSKKSLRGVLISIADYCVHNDVKMNSFFDSLKNVNKNELIKEAIMKRRQFEETERYLEKLRIEAIQNRSKWQGELFLN